MKSFLYLCLLEETFLIELMGPALKNVSVLQPKFKITRLPKYVPFNITLCLLKVVIQKIIESDELVCFGIRPHFIFVQTEKDNRILVVVIVHEEETHIK